MIEILQESFFSLGAVRLDRAGNVIGRFSEFINPEVPIPYSITKLTSITDAMVRNAPTVDVILPKFLEFAKGSMLPKVEAAVKFAKSKPGREALITLLDRAGEGIAGKTGTRIRA